MTLQIITVPCLQDNYAYLAHDPITDATAVIDVPEAAPILDELARRDWKASHILITHHHDDHVAGVRVLAAATGARIIGAAADAHRLPPLDEAVRDGSGVRVGVETAEVIAVPGHTSGHVAYYFPQSRALFSADSLMSCGCGRLFEGTPAEMWQSLSRLAALPPQTEVCSGHEYTLSNIRFALSVDPENPALLARAEQAHALRELGEPTVPVTLAEELATNPFLRAADPAIRARLGLSDATDAVVFAQLRAMKDRF